MFGVYELTPNRASNRGAMLEEIIISEGQLDVFILGFEKSLAPFAY